MHKLIEFVKDSRNEIVNKVTWPKFSELQNQSILVLVASLIFALVIGVIDFGFDNLLNIVYGLLISDS